MMSYDGEDNRCYKLRVYYGHLYIKADFSQMATWSQLAPPPQHF